MPVRATFGCLSMSRDARCWAVLFLVPVLAGCATASRGRTPSSWSQGEPGFSKPLAPAATPRVLLATSEGPPAGAEPTGSAVRGYNVPGRNPDSQMPWEFFLGNAAHRMIAYIYGVRHPGNQAYYNTETLYAILQDSAIGDLSRLLPDERNIRPDITDITLRSLFEIKPWNEQGLQDGREDARMYMAALNRVVLVGRPFTGGKEFSGETLIRFARGQYVWRLEWQTPEPGVVQYRWTRSQQRFESEVAAYEAAQWVALSEEELRRYGGWVAQAVEGLVSRREKLATVSGVVGVVIEVVGEVATAAFSGAISGRVGSGTRAQQSPAQGGGQLIPFPARPPPTAPPAKMPTAAGM